MISKEEALTRFQEIIGSKPEFAQILKSQFVDHFSIFQSWALKQALWGIERNLQEYFLSTALNRASILAGAEDREYVPIMASPATGKIRIENRNTEEVNLPANHALESGGQLGYTLDEPATIPAESTLTDVAISQKAKDIYTQTVTEEVSWLEIVFDADKTTQICGIEVYVDLGEGDGLELWTQARRFMNSNSDSHVYDIFYNYLDRIGIRFGNGIFGNILPIDAEIQAHLWLTNGDTTLLSGQRMSHMETVLDDGGSPADLTITVTETIGNGAGPEETESIRRNAHYSPVYNDSLVWAEDYKFFIRRHFPTVLWMNVWGEEEQEKEAGHMDLDFINRVYVSAYREETDFTWQGTWTVDTDYDVDDVVTSGGSKWKCLVAHTSATAPTAVDTNWDAFQYPLETLIPAKLEELHLLNKAITWVDPVYADFTLAITGQVGRRKVISEVETDILAVLEAAYGINSASRMEYAFLKDFYRLITATEHFREDGAWFEIEATGTFDETLLSELVYINMETSTVNLGYL